MTDVIDVPKVLAYLGLDPDEPPPGADTIVELANGLVDEAWKNQTDAVPIWVLGIALEVAARPLRNPKGLASWTLSHDDTSRTERLPEKAARAGVYLTAAEIIKLAGRSRRRRYGTVRTPPRH